jgi:FkbM family methyltransferase
MKKNLNDVLNSPGQRFAKFLHTLKTKIRVEKRDEIAQYKPFIKNGAVILDIGAHFGQYAKAFALLNDRSTLVYCFEPVSYTRGVLKAVLKSYKNTHIFSNGFADKPGKLNINIPLKKSGKIGPGLAHLGNETKRDFVTEAVEIDTIDNFILKHKIPRVDFIKIDIEGPELLVFKGAINTLKKFKPAIICEVNPEHMARVNLTTDELFKFMTDLGYESYLSENLSLTKSYGYTKSADYLFLAIKK